MSAYVVNMETIMVLAKAMNDYGITIPKVESEKTPFQLIIVDINENMQMYGQYLLEQNVRSVDYRYDETSEMPTFELQEIPETRYNIGTIYGCIRCYEYQACETPNYEESDIHEAMTDLKKTLLEREIKRQGYEIPWGYERDDEFTF